jgi:hypothetical protein
MNLRLSAPRASGLVCSGDRLVITTSQAREFPESPGPTDTPTEAGEGPQPDARRPRRAFWRRIFGA